MLTPSSVMKPLFFVLYCFRKKYILIVKLLFNLKEQFSIGKIAWKISLKCTTLNGIHRPFNDAHIKCGPFSGTNFRIWFGFVFYWPPPTSEPTTTGLFNFLILLSSSSFLKLIRTLLNTKGHQKSNQHTRGSFYAVSFLTRGQALPFKKEKKIPALILDLPSIQTPNIPIRKLAHTYRKVLMFYINLIWIYFSFCMVFRTKFETAKWVTFVSADWKQSA